MISELDTRLSNIDHLILSAESADDMLHAIMGDTKITTKSFVEPKYLCDCSKERLESVLVTLGSDELDSMLNEENSIKAQCHFCNKTYEFTRDDIEQIKASI